MQNFNLNQAKDISFCPDASILFKGVRYEYNHETNCSDADFIKILA